MNTAPRFHRALLLEDEPQLGLALEVALDRLGILPVRCHRLSEARDALRRESFDFALLDRQLPDGDGLGICKELRDAGFKGAILILTAHGETEDRVEGLKAGADDYLPKPFSWEELEARILALSRRLGTSATPSAALWSRDEKTLTILGERGPIALTPLEFRLVSRLLDAEGTIVSRETLLQEVWGYAEGTQTRTVDYFMARVRKHLELQPDTPKHFLSVRGAGYRFQR